MLFCHCPKSERASTRIIHPVVCALHNFSAPLSFGKSNKMGKHFGELAKIRGIITYKLSPHEQKAFAGAISNGLPNIFRRFRESVFRVAPPFIVGYLVYEGVEREHHRQSRKNPADFANDS